MEKWRFFSKKDYQKRNVSFQIVTALFVAIATLVFVLEKKFNYVSRYEGRMDTNIDLKLDIEIDIEIYHT